MAGTQVTAWPTVVDLGLYAGDDFFLDVTVTNPDGTPLDLTAGEAAAQIRTTPGSENIVAAFEATIEANTIHLHLDHDASVGLPSAAAWDCQHIDATGKVTTYVGGAVTVRGEVTRT